jgi:hypothetical protein
MEDTRREAYQIVKQFRADAVWSGNEELDFFKMLWVVHWGVETYGRHAVRKALADIQKDPEVNAANAPGSLRNTLLRSEEQDGLAAWFYRALEGASQASEETQEP